MVRRQVMNDAAMFRAIVIAGMLGTTLFCGSGCLFFPDTCNDGFNMTTPRVEDGVESDSSGLFLRVTWDEGTGTGADLPPAYFADVTLEPLDEGELLADSVVLTATRELTVRFADTVTSQTLIDATSTGFTLEFSDRREHIDCTHIGSNDRYLLNVMIDFDNTGMVEGTIFEQRFIPGPI